MRTGPPRGEFAPPTLRPAASSHIPGGGAGPPRGEFAPPTLRLQLRLQLWLGADLHRGANSPLLHCGASIKCGEWLNRGHRGANSPLLHCGFVAQGDPVPQFRSPRGEFAPPTLRHTHLAGRQRPRVPPRGEFAPPTLRHQRLDHRVRRGLPPRADFAPPTLRRITGTCRWCGRGPPRGEFAPPTLRRSNRKLV